MSLAMEISEVRVALDPERAEYNKRLALDHARSIREYWAARGYTVTVNVVNRGWSNQMRGIRYDIETDLVNGRPKDFRTQPLRE